MIELKDVAQARAGGGGGAVPAAGRAPARPARRWWLMGAALLLAIAGAAWLWTRALPPAVLYATATAGRGAIVQAIVASGSVNPVTTVQVGTYVSGVIQAIHCDFNSQVRTGQLCAKIDPRPYETAVEQAAAALATARAQLAKDGANLAYAQRAEERSRPLLAQGFLSQDTADAAANARQQAAAQVELDRAEAAQRAAQWRAARINLGYTDIVAPVDGTVVSRNVTQGQTVAASFQTPTLFLVATDLARMQVDASVGESDIGRVAAGNPATFTVSAYPDRVFSGRVRQVRQAPQAVQNVVTYDAVIDVANPDLALKPGMTATVRIVTRRADGVLRVPEAALRYRPEGVPAGQGGAHVWILDGGRPRRAPVTTGLADDAYAQITGGSLRDGDAVILAERGAGGNAAQRPPPRAAFLPGLR